MANAFRNRLAALRPMATIGLAACLVCAVCAPRLRAQETSGDPERLPLTIDARLDSEPTTALPRSSAGSEAPDRGLLRVPQSWFTTPTDQEIIVPLTEHDLRQLKTVHTAALESSRVVKSRPAAESAESSLEPSGDATATTTDEPLDAAVATLVSPYRTLFFENDFRYLNHPEVSRQFLSDAWKQMTFGRYWVVDAGGEYRLRQQNEANLRRDDFSTLDDNFLLERTRLYLHARYGESAALYAEMLDAASHWENHSPRDVEENRFDLQNLFADVLLTSAGGGETWLRGGRQELLYGSQRLVSPVDWLNTRQTFDGVKAFHRGPDWRWDAFWMRPIDFAQQIGQDHNLNAPNLDRQFYGVYATRQFGGVIADERPGSPQLEAPRYGLDAYYLANTDSVTQLDSHLLGLRAFMNDELWQGDAEAAVQFGRTARGDLAAGFFSGSLVRTLSLVSPYSKVGIGYDWASGDRTPGDGQDGTFQLLYGDFHSYLGYCDLIGRRNIRDLSLKVVSGDEEDELTIAWHLFQLASVNDALYNARGIPIRLAPTGDAGGAVGQELDVTYRAVSSSRSDWLIGYSHFYPGSFVRRTTSPAALRDVDFFYWQWTTRF